MGEGQAEPLRGVLDRLDGMDRLARVANPVETGDLHSLRLPSLQTRHVELAILGVESSTHRRAGELHREANHTALHLTVASFLVHHEVQGTLAVAHVQQVLGKRSPLVAVNPHLAAAAVVILVVRHPG